MANDPKLQLILRCNDLLKEYNSRVATLYDIKNNVEFNFITQDALNYNVIRCNKIFFDMFYLITEFFKVEDIKILNDNNIISKAEYDIFNLILQYNPIVKDFELKEIGILITNYNTLAKTVIHILNVIPTIGDIN